MLLNSTNNMSLIHIDISLDIMHQLYNWITLDNITYMKYSSQYICGEFLFWDKMHCISIKKKSTSTKLISTRTIFDGIA